MREFRRKQRIFKLARNIAVIATALLLLVLIGFESSLYNGGMQTLALALHYIGEGMVVVSLVLVMLYSSKYAKSDTFLTNVEYELSDCGYYLSQRKSASVEDAYIALRDSLISRAYSLAENTEINELEFALNAAKRNEIVYAVTEHEVDKNDVIAYLDSVVYDLTAIKMRRSGNAVLVFVCDTASEDAVALSKSITAMGRKENLHIALAIDEISSGRVYFLGNNPTKCQQMIAEYVMGCEVPIPDSLKGERLPFQDELEEHMKQFNIAEYRKGNFFSH